MSWTDVSLKFVTGERKFPGGLVENLSVRQLPNQKHMERADRDYERHFYRSIDESKMDYEILIERIEKPTDKTRHDIIVTVSYCTLGNYDSVLETLAENAKRLRLERILEDKK